jgi:hypothetical protein
MQASAKRTILRWVHVVFALPLVGLVYGPIDQVQPYLAYFRYFYFPMLVISGLLMWKGHLLGRLFNRGQ